MLPANLVATYWSNVSSLLVKKHGLSETESQVAVADFRDRIRDRIGEMIYHSEAEETACTIAGGVERGGFEEPPRSKSSSRTGRERRA